MKEVVTIKIRADLVSTFPEYHGQQTWVDWAPLLSWCVLFALFGGAFFRVYCRKRRLQLKDQ